MREVRALADRVREVIRPVVEAEAARGPHNCKASPRMDPVSPQFSVIRPLRAPGAHGLIVIASLTR